MSSSTNQPLVETQKAYREARQAIRNAMLQRAKQETLFQSKRSGLLMGLGLLACSQSAIETVWRETRKDVLDERMARKDEDEEEAPSPDEALQTEENAGATAEPAQLFLREALSRHAAEAAQRQHPIFNQRNTEMRHNFLEEMKLREHGTSVLIGVHHHLEPSASGTQNDRTANLLVPNAPGSSEHVYLPQ